MVAGDRLGKFTVTDGMVEGTTISAEQFKNQIKTIATSKDAFFNLPINASKQASGSCDIGTPKLDGKFCLSSPGDFIHATQTIELQINPDGALDKDGNPASFAEIKAALQEAVDTWNNSPNS